jgi:glycerol-3-phosphate dehydrogenase
MQELNMRRIRTDVLVIGGGATGTGVLRDLAMRGFRCVLVERRDLSYGTTGRFHGLLHSGCRYVVKDPNTAKECYEENQILRRIMPQCIEDTHGYFVLTPEDDPNYVSDFLAGCKKASIPIESVPIRRMLHEEPQLNPNILQCFLVPDASADSFLATELNAVSAREHGALILKYHEVLNFNMDQKLSSGKRTIVGASCHDVVTDEDVQIEANIVINAAGAWCGKLAQTAGINIPMIPGKGTMLALNHRVVNTIINRCKMPSDGDILVPIHTVAVIGTTDKQVANPDSFSIEPSEIRQLLEEGEKIIPGFKNLRILRAWAGVRPLVKGEASGNNREISRAFTLLDHAERDGVDGLITITGGKWTTYRKMAEACVNKVCEKLNINRPCQTHSEILPDASKEKPHHHYLGARLKNIEAAHSYGDLICECELLTRENFEKSIIQSDVKTLDDIRRVTRLGMGPCQGAYCTLRAIGFWHALKKPPVPQTNTELRDFLQERWKGNLAILRGSQLRQSRFNELIYFGNLNISNLPDSEPSKIGVDDYANPEEKVRLGTSAPPYKIRNQASQRPRNEYDIVIVGAGYAGLFAAWQAAEHGYKTKLITKGWGTPYWGSGCIDIIGYKPDNYHTPIDSPRKFLENFIKENPDHPYARTGLGTLDDAVESFLAFCKKMGYPYTGSMYSNIWLPTALGTIRPSCLVPAVMSAGDVTLRSPMLIVGFDGFHDFSARLIADNLNHQGYLAKDITLSLEPLRELRLITGITLARLFDTQEFRRVVINTIKPLLQDYARVGFPAILGLDHFKDTKEELETGLGVPVFEIPGLPPSIPGIRLQKLLISAIEQNKGSVFNGMEVSASSSNGNEVQSVWSEAAARQVVHIAHTFILATGGILGGGITIDQGSNTREPIFNLPIDVSNDISYWFQKDYLSELGHPVFKTSIPVNQSFQPIDNHGEIIYSNLYAIGNQSANCDPIRERSLEGIALATGFKVIENLKSARDI